MVLLGEAAGSYALTDILHRGDVVRASPLYPAILTLVLVGAFTKSAQFPFHFWLPHAMAAPTPVSAYLHSATMVKAGIFLMARLWPVLGGTEAWFIVVTGTGLVTMLVGAWIALFKDDLEGVLAHSTVSHLGLMTMLLGIGTPYAATAAVFHILNHAIFKAALFMSAGIVDHETHTRDIRSLGGLVHVMPISATLALIASAAMAGVPLFNGFLSKEMMLEAAHQTSYAGVDDDARRDGHGRRVAVGGLLECASASESILASRRPNRWRLPAHTTQWGFGCLLRTWRAWRLPSAFFRSSWSAASSSERRKQSLAAEQSLRSIWRSGMALHSRSA